MHAPHDRVTTMAMPPTDRSTLLQAVIRVAREAGEAILRHYHAGVSAETKDDGSPVTAADHASEAVILPALHALTPDIPVVSEEAASGGAVPDISGGRFWLVDPLDGTREFLNRNGEFTVNIGLVGPDGPELGVVHAPAIAVTYAGAVGETAFRLKDETEPEPIAVRTPPVDGLTVVASRRHGSGEALDRFLAGLAVADRISAGSALKFGLVAAGEADVYPRFGPTMEWDTAAGHAVVLAAGGRVERADGGPLTYGRVADGFLNPFFIAWGA